MSTLSRIRQHPERSAPAEASAILARGHVAHVGFSHEGQPFVLPFSYHFDARHPESLYLHGARSSRTLRALADGSPVCVTVTLVDGLVYSRDALHHSMNYRSVVCFGNGRMVEDGEEKARIFAGMTERYFPGRTAPRDYRAASEKELSATEVIEVRINEWSAKRREGGPTGPRDGEGEWGTETCGVVELPRL